jgi:hypothetical protein
MRILSLNVWGGAMFDALASWLPSCDADIVCLQEVTRTDGLDGWTTYADGDRMLPQRADLVADVEGLLPGHQTHYRQQDKAPHPRYLTFSIFSIFFILFMNIVAP